MTLAVFKSRVVQLCNADTPRRFRHTTVPAEIVRVFSGQYGTSLQLKLGESDAELFKEGDAVALKYLWENKEEVFTKERKMVVSDADVAGIFVPSVVDNKVAKVKVPDNAKLVVDVYDAAKTLVKTGSGAEFAQEVADLLADVRNVRVAFTECPVVWVFNGKAGVSWKVSQIQILDKAGAQTVGSE